MTLKAASSDRKRVSRPGSNGFLAMYRKETCEERAGDLPRGQSTRESDGESMILDIKCWAAKWAM